MTLSDIVKQSCHHDVAVLDPGCNYRERGVVTVTLVGIIL